MKKFIKVVSLLLALLLVLTSCGTKDGKKDGVDTIVMHLVGDKPKDYDEVLDVINEKLRKDVGAELEVYFMGWGDWSKKYPLLMSGTESVDMIYTVGYMGYQDYARKGAYLDIKDLVKEYAPKSYAALSEDIINSNMVDGGLYCLPTREVTCNPHGYVVRGDLMDKYDIPEIKSAEDFIYYLEVVKENTDIMPYNASKTDIAVFPSRYKEIGTGIYYDMTDKGNYYSKLYTVESSEFRKYEDSQYQAVRDAYIKGLWPKDVVMNQLPSKDAFLNGSSASTILNLLNFNDLYAKVMATNPEWEPRFYYRGTEEEIPVLLATGSGVAISRSSKHPEKCLQILELFNNDKEYNRLTTFGIEGKHYVDNGDGTYSFPKGVDMNNTGFAPDTAGCWPWRNTQHFMMAGTRWPGYEKAEAEVREISIWDPYSGFVFDNTNIINEISAIKSIKAEDDAMLSWGTLDHKDITSKRIKRLKEAGLKKCQEETKKQIKEFAKTKK